MNLKFRTRFHLQNVIRIKISRTKKKGEHLFLNGFQEFGGDCEDPIHWDVGMTKVVTFSTLQIGNWKWRPKRTETTEMKFIRLFSTDACWEFWRFGMILYRTQVECLFFERIVFRCFWKGSHNYTIPSLKLIALHLKNRVSQKEMNHLPFASIKVGVFPRVSGRLVFFGAIFRLPPFS